MSNPYRFVILHHQTPMDDHWDIMLEADSALITWSIPPQSPAGAGSIGATFVCSATRLPDHRKYYLDYEGEITGNRGMVSRIDAGTYEQIAPYKYLLYGMKFSGELTVKENMMTFAPDSYSTSTPEAGVPRRD